VQRAVARYRRSAEGSGLLVNEASAELAASSKVARLGQRPLLRKGMPAVIRMAAAAVLRAEIRVHRFSEPLHKEADCAFKCD
jgi:hypothetical protein